VNFTDPRGLYGQAAPSGDPGFGNDGCRVNGIIDVPGPLCGYTDIGPLGSPFTKCQVATNCCSMR
jgi:hypothetical protein